MSQIIFFQDLKVPLYCIKFLQRHLNKLHVSKKLITKYVERHERNRKNNFKNKKNFDETFTIIFVMSMNSNIIHNIKF